MKNSTASSGINPGKARTAERGIGGIGMNVIILRGGGCITTMQTDLVQELVQETMA